jgi:hypothetical protein
MWWECWAVRHGINKSEKLKTKRWGEYMQKERKTKQKSS